MLQRLYRPLISIIGATDSEKIRKSFKKSRLGPQQINNRRFRIETAEA